jgi:hypothetical protein
MNHSIARHEDPTRTNQIGNASGPWCTVPKRPSAGGLYGFPEILSRAKGREEPCAERAVWEKCAAAKQNLAKVLVERTARIPG